jgi:hypothetical protein
MSEIVKVRLDNDAWEQFNSTMFADSGVEYSEEQEAESGKPVSDMAPQRIEPWSRRL